MLGFSTWVLGDWTQVFTLESMTVLARKLHPPLSLLQSRLIVESLESLKSRAKLSWATFSPLNSHLLSSSMHALTSLQLLVKSFRMYIQDAVFFMNQKPKNDTRQQWRLIAKISSIYSNLNTYLTLSPMCLKSASIYDFLYRSSVSIKTSACYSVGTWNLR